jgi:hypothetical protein
LVGASWQTPEVAYAQVERSERTATPTATTAALVELRVVGTEDSFHALKGVLGDRQLGGTRLHWSRVERFAPQQILSLFSREKVVVHCWIDLSDPAQAHLYFVAPKHDRFMMRDFDLEHRFGTLELASLAQIVETSIDVLLSDTAAGMSRREIEATLGRTATQPPAPAAARVSPPRAPSLPPPHARYGWLADATYAFRQYSSELALLHGPTLDVGVERRHLDARQWLQISAGFAFPARVSGRTASAEVRRYSLSASLSHLWTFPQAPSQSLGPRATVGFGYVGATPRSGNMPGTYDLNSPARDLEPYLGLGADFLVGLGVHTALIARFDAEAVLRPVRHAILVNGSEETLTEGRRLRLGASLGLQVR